MSTWLSLFRRNSTIPEEESEGADANTASAASGETSTPRAEELATRPDYGDTQSLENLNDEQRQHIKEVMKRAERSGQSAKIVMDSRRLRNVRGGRVRYNVEERDSAVSEEEEDAMIQMDPLPENIEITVGQFSCSSYASSEFSVTESEQLERESLLERDISSAQRPSNAMANASITEEKRLSVMRSVQLLSHKISEWIKSLDEEDDYVSEARKKPATSQASRTRRASHPRSPSKEEWSMIDEQARLLVASAISSTLFEFNLLQWADELTGAIWKDAMRSYVIPLETCSPTEDVSSDTSGADEHSSTASAGASIAEALTRQELEHIANIQLLAEKDAFSALPSCSPFGGSNPVLELAGEVERSQVQAPIPQSSPPASAPNSSEDKTTDEKEADFFNVDERGLTQEEVEHIERVGRLAEEDALYTTTRVHIPPDFRDVGPSSESASHQLPSVSPPSTPTSSADEEDASSSAGSNLSGDIQLGRVEQQVGAIEETEHVLDGGDGEPQSVVAEIKKWPDSASTSSADEATPSPASFDLEEQLRTLECEKYPPLMDDASSSREDGTRKDSAGGKYAGTLEQNSTRSTRSTSDGIYDGLTEEEIRHIERIKQLADEDSEALREFPFGLTLDGTADVPEDGFLLQGAPTITGEPSEEFISSTTTSGADTPAITGEVDAQFDWPVAEKDDGMDYSRPIDSEHTMAIPNSQPPGASSDSSTDTSGADDSPAESLESGAEIADDGVREQEPATHVDGDIIDHEVPAREKEKTPAKIKPTRPPPPARYAPSVPETVGNQMRPKVSKILEEDEIAYLAESVPEEYRLHHDIPSITYTMYDHDEEEEDVDEAIRTGGVEEEDAMKKAATTHTEKRIEEKPELAERPATDEFIRRSQIRVMDEEPGEGENPEDGWDSGETSGADSASTPSDADTFEIVPWAEEKDSETASPPTVALPKIPPTPRRPPPPPPSVAQHVAATDRDKAMKLTEKELQHIAQVEQRANSEVGSEHPVPLSIEELAQAGKPLVGLTEEELAHIAQIEQLAGQDSNSKIQPGPVVGPTEPPNDQLPTPRHRFRAFESEGHSSEEDREEFERVCAILEGPKGEADVNDAPDEQSHEVESISSGGTSGPDSLSASATTATSIPASREDLIADFAEAKNQSTPTCEHSSDEAEEEFAKVRMLLGEMTEEETEMSEPPRSESSSFEMSSAMEGVMHGEREWPVPSGSSTEECHEVGMTRPTVTESASLVKVESALLKTGSTIAAMTMIGDGGSREGERSLRDEGSVSDVTSLADSTQQSPSIESADEELIDNWSIDGEERKAAVPIKSPSVSISTSPRWEADVSQQFHRAERSDVPTSEVITSTSPSTPTEEGGSSVREETEAISNDEVEVEVVGERPHVEEPLTAEELEHIARVQLLAEESWCGIDIPQVDADAGSHTEDIAFTVNQEQSPTSRQRSYSSSTATSGPDEDGVVQAAEAAVARIKKMDSLPDQPQSESISETERSSTTTSGADEMGDEEAETETGHESITEEELFLNRTTLSTEEMSRPGPSSAEDHVSSTIADTAPSTISVSYTNVLREKGGGIWSSISGMEPSLISPLDVPQTQPRDTTTLGEGEKVKVMFSDERLRSSFNDDTEEEEEVAEGTMEEWHPEEIEPNLTTPQTYHDAQWNAYEECERLGIMDEAALQENTDFLLALNSYAQRLAADVAEYAAYDISSIYSLQLNPRARYFGATDYCSDQLLSNVVVSDDQPDQLSSTSNETPAEDESGLGTTLDERLETPSDYHIPQGVAVDSQHPSEGTASRIFSVFSRRRSSQSAIPFIQQSAGIINSLLSLTDRSSSERKSSVASESPMTRRSSPGDILDLVNRRRSSANSKDRDASSSSGVKLPAEALEGLSETEKQHILEVVAASYATTSGVQGVDIVDYSPGEMLLPSPDNNVRYEITEPIDANLDREEQEHLERENVQRGQSHDSPFVLAGGTSSKIIGPERLGMNEGEECLALNSELEPTTQVRSAIEVDGELKEPLLDRDSAFLRPITTMEDVLQQEGITAEEMEHIRRVMHMAEVEGMDIPGRELQPPLSAVIDQYKQQQSDYSPSTSRDGGERDEWGIGTRSEADSALGDSVLTGLSVGLSDEEVEHIRRVTEMADKELSFSGPPPTSSEFWSIDAITEKEGEEDGDTTATKRTSRSNVFRRDRDEVGVSNAAVTSSGDSETDYIAQEVARLETELQKMNESLMAGDWDKVEVQQQGPSQVAASPGSAEQRKPIINDGSDVSVVCVAANISIPPATPPTQIEKDVSALHSLTSVVSVEGKSGGWEKEEVPHSPSSMAPAPSQHPMQLHAQVEEAETAPTRDSRSWPFAPPTPTSSTAESEEAVEWGRGGVGYVKETSREIAEVRIAKMDESELEEEDAKDSHLLSEKELAIMPLEGEWHPDATTGGRPIDALERTLPPPSKPTSSSQPPPQHGIYAATITTEAAGSSCDRREGEWWEGESGDTLLQHDYGVEALAPLSNPPTANTDEASQFIRLHFEEGDDGRWRLEPRWKCAAVISNDGVSVTHSHHSVTELPPHSPSTSSLPTADEPSQQEKEQNTSTPNASMSGFVKGISGGGSTGSGGGGFGGFSNRFGLSKLASDAIKGAKQASAELSAKATKAAQAAQLGLDSMQQPPRPHASKSMINIAAPMSRPTPSPMPVPLGLEDLSEEERAKILAVMQSAAMEEDASEGQLQRKLSASRTMDVLPSRPAPPFVESPQLESPADAQMTAGLSGLSEEEREKIKAVMRMANEEEEVIGAVPVMGLTIPSASVDNNKSATTLSRDLWEDEVPMPARVGHLHHVIDDNYEEDEAVVTEFEEYPVGHSDEVVEDLEKYGKPVPTGRDIAAASRTVDELDPVSTSKDAAPTTIGTESESGQLRDEDDVWMEKSEYRAPDSWEAKSPSGFGVPNRMWTTDFSEDASEIFEADSDQHPLPYSTGGDEKKEWKVAAGGGEGPEDREEEVEQETVITADTVRGCWEAGAPSFEEVQIQMEDPMSPLLSSFPSMVVTDSRQVKPLNSMAPPEIVLTTAVDGEESDGTPPSSDGEEDYPDRVIEAPSEVNPSLTSFSATQQKQERERAEQAAFARQVLQEIQQSFGEVANDEFDVQWARGVEAAGGTHESQSEQVSKAETRADGHEGVTPKVSEFEKRPSSAETDKPVINPFLEVEEFMGAASSGQESDDETDHHHGRIDVVQHIALDEDDEQQQLTEAEQYYRAQQSPYFSHRPGPVYTIPESDEESPVVNTEGIYKARELDRKPLHTVHSAPPPLIPESALRAREKRARNSQRPVSADHAAHMRPQTQMVPVPVRTAPPPPDSATGAAVTNGNSAHKFTTDIPQPDDLFLPPHTHGGLPVSKELAMRSSTIGSCLETTETADHAAAPIDSGAAVDANKLKRSPAMMLPSDESLLKENALSLEGAVHGKQQQDLARTPDYRQLPSTTTKASPITSTTSRGPRPSTSTAASGEMGRRKLPPLPPTTGYPPPSYSTSLAQQLLQQQLQREAGAPKAPSPAVEYKDASCNGAVPSMAQQTSPLFTSPLVSSNQAFLARYNYYRSPATNMLPASALYTKKSGSLPATCLGYSHQQPHPTDPAIIPGATFRILPTELKHAQQRSYSSPQRSRVSTTEGAAASSSFGPTSQHKSANSTLSQVIFKKELRERLAEQRSLLEASEIEANNRRYMINRHLVSLAPVSRPPELEQMPAIVHCQLPRELVEGARVVPASRAVVTERTSRWATTTTAPTMLNYSFGEAQPTTKSYAAAAANYAGEPLRLKRTVGVQSELMQSPDVKERDGGRSGIKWAAKLPKPSPLPYSTTDSSTQTSKCAETQTSSAGVDDDDGHVDLVEEEQVEDERRRWRKRERHLRRQQQYQRHFFTPNDSTPAEIEARRRRVEEELRLRRREHLLRASVGDLRNLDDDMRRGDMMETLSYRQLPHYNSLPRLPAIDPYPYSSYPHLTFESFQPSYAAPTSHRWDRRLGGYTSLPRNYETRRGLVEHEDALGPSSLFSQYARYGDERYGGVAFRSGSMCDLRRSDPYVSTPLDLYPPPPTTTTTTTILGQRGQDDIYMGRRRFDRDGGGGGRAPERMTGDGMLSQYAHYLNQDLLERERRELEDPLFTDSFIKRDAVGRPMMPEPQLSSSQQPQQLPRRSEGAFQTPSIQWPESPQVYSRREENYGSCAPFAPVIGDYGNYWRNPRREQHQPGGSRVSLEGGLLGVDWGRDQLHQPAANLAYSYDTRRYENEPYPIDATGSWRRPHPTYPTPPHHYRPQSQFDSRRVAVGDDGLNRVMQQYTRKPISRPLLVHSSMSHLPERDSDDRGEYDFRNAATGKQNDFYTAISRGETPSDAITAPYYYNMCQSSLQSYNSYIQDPLAEFQHYASSYGFLPTADGGFIDGR